MTEKQMMNNYKENKNELPFINLLLMGGHKLREKAIAQYMEEEQVEDDFENWTNDVQDALDNLMKNYVNYYNVVGLCQETKDLDVEYAIDVIFNLQYEGILTKAEIEKIFVNE